MSACGAALWFTLALPPTATWKRIQPRLLEYLQSDSSKPSFKTTFSREETPERCRREMDGCTFTLVNDVVIPIISVLHSIGLMDFRCGGLDLSMLGDKLSCLRCSFCATTPAVSGSPGPVHDRPGHRDGFGKI